MSISVAYTAGITVTETFTGQYVSSGDDTATFNGMNESDTYTSGTAVPVTKHSDYQLTMTAGAGTINLAALPGKTADETVVGTGLKVQFFKFRNLSTNANPIKITFGASNGYDLLGADFIVNLLPGQSIQGFLDEAAPDIASGDRLLDVTGTGSQILEVFLVMG